VQGTNPRSSLESIPPSPEFMPTTSGDEDEETEYESTDTLSTLSSLEWSSSDSAPELPQRFSAEDMERMRSPSPAFDVAPRINNHPHEPPSLEPPHPVPLQVHKLVQLQGSDGTFALDTALGEIVGHAALQKPQDIDVDDRLWVTALAVAYLRKNLTYKGQGDSLDGRWIK
jgi:hypothetical protein